MDRSGRKHSRQESDNRGKQRKNRRKQKGTPDNSMTSGDALRRKKGMSKNADAGPSPQDPEGMQNPISPSNTVHINTFKIRLRKLYLRFDGCKPTIDETEIKLNYTFPLFRAKAWVEVPALPATKIQIGWIHVCTDLINLNFYGDHGCTSYEVPELNNLDCNMINAASEETLPWFNITKGTKSFSGPSQFNFPLTEIDLEYNTSYSVDLDCPAVTKSRDSVLTFTYVNSDYTSYLVVKNLITQQYFTLRTVKWNLEIAIDVDSHKPPGHRAKFIGPCEQEEAKVVPESSAMKLHVDALKLPNLIGCKGFFWRPKNAYPKIIQTAADEADEKDEMYVIDSRDYFFELEEYNKKSFLLNQKKKMTARNTWKLE